MKNRPQRTEWTIEQARSFKDWHERRLVELNYPPEIVKELRKTRDNWLSKVRIK